MAFVRMFLELNQQVVLFVYGLVFFVPGLAMALQSRRFSRLDLARGLSWLAAFGITHGLNEWGELFIPIQATYLSQEAIRFLDIVQLLLLAGSFICLFEFGVAMLRPLGRARWLYSFPAVLLGVWVVGAFFIALPISLDVSVWHDEGSALARYIIGLPGGLAAAYGLRQQTFRRIAPLGVPRIVNMLRVAGIALAVYALFAGLVPPPVPFFPGNWLNSQTFVNVLGIPVIVVRSLIGLVLGVAMIRALEIFEVETGRMIEAMEQQQILAAERDRIARELHDGAIQTVYTAGLLVESARHMAENDSPLAGRLDKAIDVLNDAIRDLRRSLGELRVAPSDEPFPVALRQMAQDPRFRSLVDVSLEVDLPEGEPLSDARATHVLAIVNEALSNAVRHAHARQVRVSARRQDGRLVVMVQDDGSGLPRDVKAGFGLRNMRDRARLLGGQLDVTADRGKGTAVTLDVPWTD